MALQIRKEASVLLELPIYWRAQRLPMGWDRGTSPLVTKGSAQSVKTPKERRERVNLTILLDCSRGDNEAMGHFSGAVPSRKKRE